MPPLTPESAAVVLGCLDVSRKNKCKRFFEGFCVGAASTCRIECQILRSAMDLQNVRKLCVQQK